MIFELNHWDKAYKRLIQNIRSNGKRGNNEDDGYYIQSTQSSVLLLCAMDADALCAARILSYLLRADNIPYQLRPCSSHASLVQILSNLKKREDTEELEVGCIVLLNIGGMSNLTKFYVSDDDEEPILPISTLTFVMDCHRPWHLANIHAGDNIIMFKEEALEDDVPSDGDGLSGDEEESDSDSESDDSDSEEEFEDEDPPSKKQRIDPSYEKANDESSTLQEDSGTQSNPQDEREYPDENASHTTPTSSIHSTPQKPLTSLSFRQIQRNRRDQITKYYYSGSYHQAPVSWIAYTLSRQMRFGDLGDLLWLACVGVTDAFLHTRLDMGGYTEFVSDLRRHIQRLYPDDEVTRAMNAVHSSDGTQVGISSNGRIMCQTEFRFMLLRHWSLLDAMIHSNFVGTKLKVWKEQGRFRLTEMLAMMGFPLEECKQPWAFMKPSLKRILREAVLEHKENFDLEDINYTGFIRVSGYKSLISASDMSYAITALLESETPATRTQISSSHDDPQIIQSFNIAYDALNAKSISIKSEGSSLSNLVNGGDLSGSEGLGAGIRLAMQLQKNIISTAVGLVDKHAITRLKHFRYAYLYGSKDKLENVFARPLALCQLAKYLMDMHRDKWIDKNARPLVLLTEKPQTKSFLIVGYQFADYDGDIAKNKFKRYFEMAVKSMEGLCEVHLESFEGNVVEVEAGGEQRFIEQLHYLMDVTNKL